MTSTTELDLVVLGNLIVDDIVYDDGRTRMGQPGGAALYMGLAAPLWGLRTGLVSVAGHDFPRSSLEDLRSRGVDLGGVRETDEPGLRTWLLYEGTLRRVVHRLEGSSHVAASPRVADIPAHWRARAVHLAPMPIDLQTEIVSDLRASPHPPELISLDPFELLREDDLEPWRSLLEGVDILFLSEDEVPDSAVRAQPEPLLRTLLGGPLETLLFKQGARGGIALRSTDDEPCRWPARAAEVADTTGAGDAFACGVLAGLLHGRALERALQWGVVAASFAIEGPGTETLLQTTPEAAQRRLDLWFGARPTPPGGACPPRHSIT